MAILERFTDIIKANINELLDKCEDPAKMIDQYLRDMTEDLAVREVRGHIVRVQVAGGQCGLHVKQVLEMGDLLGIIFQRLHIFQIADMLALEHIAAEVDRVVVIESEFLRRLAVKSCILI